MDTRSGHDALMRDARGKTAPGPPCRLRRESWRARAFHHRAGGAFLVAHYPRARPPDTGLCNVRSGWVGFAWSATRFN